MMVSPPSHTKDDRGASVPLVTPRQLSKQEGAESGRLDELLTSCTPAWLRRAPMSLALVLVALLVVSLVLTFAGVYSYHHLVVGAILVTFVAIFAVAIVLSRYELRQYLRVVLGDGRCASCGYRLDGLSRAEDGCVVCPECGAAWWVAADVPSS